MREGVGRQSGDFVTHDMLLDEYGARLAITRMSRVPKLAFKAVPEKCAKWTKWPLYKEKTEKRALSAVEKREAEERIRTGKIRMRIFSQQNIV